MLLCCFSSPQKVCSFSSGTPFFFFLAGCLVFSHGSLCLWLFWFDIAPPFLLAPPCFFQFFSVDPFISVWLYPNFLLGPCVWCCFFFVFVSLFLVCFVFLVRQEAEDPGGGQPPAHKAQARRRGELDLRALLGGPGLVLGRDPAEAPRPPSQRKKSSAPDPKSKSLESAFF